MQLQTIAILGSSGSGKTALSLEIARKYPCAILSLDSLSIYKEIDIVSAKPNAQERYGVPHFGLDVLPPNKPQNAQNFINEYEKARNFCEKEQRHLLIVGGSGFYLKALLNGLSSMPSLNDEERDEIALKIKNLGDLQAQYEFLERIDKSYVKTLKAHDTYRITRALEIYFSTHCIPSEYFALNPPKPVLKHCEIIEILLEKEILKERIRQRTQNMIKQGLIEEVESLIAKYGLTHQWAKSIGIKETINFLNAQNGISLECLRDSIILHTMQLAKRQRTFNKTQFPPHFRGISLEANIDKMLSLMN